MTPHIGAVKVAEPTEAGSQAELVVSMRSAFVSVLRLDWDPAFLVSY